MTDLMGSAPDKATGLAWIEAQKWSGYHLTSSDNWHVTRKTGLTIQDAFGIEIQQTEVVPSWHFNIRLFDEKDAPDTKSWLPLVGDPKGFMNPDGIKLFDASTIKSPTNVWG